MLPWGASELAAFAKERLEVFVPDRFDHLDRHELVEPSPQLAIILQQHGDPIREPRLAHAGDGEIVLLARHGRGRHAATEVCGRMNRQCAPAGADFEQMVFGPEMQLAASPIDLGHRGFGERAVLALEDPAGVSHRVVEHQAIEIVSEVVMLVDIPAAAAVSVPAHGMLNSGRELLDGGDAAVEGIGDSQIADEQPDKLREVVARPFARHKRLGGPQTAAENQATIKPRMMHGREDLQLAIRLAQQRDTIRLVQFNGPLAQARQRSQQDTPQNACDQPPRSLWLGTSELMRSTRRSLRSPATVTDGTSAGE